MKKHIEKLRRRAARTMAVEPLAIRPLRGIVSISFDDFPKSAWEVAGPLLKHHEIKASYYVAGRMCDRTNLGKPQFSENDLQELFEDGHEVGCHTFSHVSVMNLDAETLNKELDRNAEWVAERLDGHKMTHFAYPFGDVSLSAKKLLGKRFNISRGVRDGINVEVADRNNLSAIGLESRRLPHYDLERIFEQTAKQRGWLITYGHDIGRDPTPYGCTLRDLERVIELARENRLDILPVGKALQKLQF